MATLELDPVFVKALKLLHSKSKDSTEQLKQLLDDAIAQRNAAKGETQAEKPPTKTSAQVSEEQVKKRESDMKSLEKLKQDLTGLSHEAKKPRLDPPRPSKEEKLQKEREKEKARKEKEQKEREERERKAAAERERLREAEDSSSSSADDAEDDGSSDVAADDFAMDLGISCVVCRQFDVSSGNQLVECQECHNLYHQECHRPPVTERDVNDPRFVWYCTRCMKSLKKMQVSKPQKAKAVPAPNVSKDPASIQKQIKSEPGSMFSFRRVEPKSSSTKDPISSQSAKPLSGLASLAANLYGKSSHEPSKSVKLEQSKSRSGSVSKAFQSDKTLSSNTPERKLSLTAERGAKQVIQDKLAAAALLMNKSGITGNKAGGSAEGGKSGPSGLMSVNKGASSAPTPTSGNKGGGAAPLVPISGKSGEPKAIAADKRMQMMKKKAAVKLQEKRSSLK